VVHYLRADDADVAGGRMVPADHFPEGWVALGDDLCSLQPCARGQERAPRRARRACIAGAPPTIKLHFDPRIASSWFGAENYSADVLEKCPTPCAIAPDRASADVAFSLGQGEGPGAAVVNMEAHSFPADDVVSISYHADADVRATYGFELEAYTAHRFDDWCCERHRCDRLVCGLMELGELLPTLLPGETPSRAGALMSVFVSATCARHGDFIPQLMGLVAAHSFGACFKNRDETTDPAALRLAPLAPNRFFDKAWIASSGYRFYLAVENTIADDYVTEKFFMGFKLHATVMVYLGAPNARSYAPSPGAFIHANAFPSVAALAAYIHRVDSDPTLFASFLAWRQRPLLLDNPLRWAYNRSVLSGGSSSVACRTCAWRAALCDDACDTVASFSEVLLFGDSMCRHAAQAMISIARGDIERGAVMQWRLGPGETCVGEEQYAEHPPPCRQNSVRDTRALDSFCARGARIRFLEWYQEGDVGRYLGCPGDDETTMCLQAIKPGSALLIFPPGLHAGLRNAERLIRSYVDPLVEAARRANDTFVVLVGLHAMLPNMPAAYAQSQSEEAVRFFNDALRGYARAHGLAFVDPFHLSEGQHSADGVHLGLRANVLKARLLLDRLRARA
jgi:hypothetical protein